MQKHLVRSITELHKDLDRMNALIWRKKSTEVLAKLFLSILKMYVCIQRYCLISPQTLYNRLTVNLPLQQVSHAEK